MTDRDRELLAANCKSQGIALFEGGTSRHAWTSEGPPPRERPSGCDLMVSVVSQRVGGAELDIVPGGNAPDGTPFFNLLGRHLPGAHRRVREIQEPGPGNVQFRP